ncbi:hypothetical protein ABVT39_012849 [Epinephelus coioides]
MIPPLTEGQQTTLTCTDPEITWMWGGAGETDSHITGNITAVKTEDLTAVTQRHSSTLTLNPSAKHHGTDVTCKVSFTNNITTEETVTLNVTYVKEVKITGNTSVKEALITWTKYSDEIQNKTETILQNDTVTELQNDSVTDLQNDTVTDLQNDTVTDLENNTVTDLQNDTVTDLQNDSVTDLQNNTVTDLQNDTVTDLQNDTVTDLQNNTVTDLQNNTVTELQNDTETFQKKSGMDTFSILNCEHPLHYLHNIPLESKNKGDTKSRGQNLHVSAENRQIMYEYDVIGQTQDSRHVEAPLPSFSLYECIDASAVHLPQK